MNIFNYEFLTIIVTAFFVILGLLQYISFINLRYRDNPDLLKKIRIKILFYLILVICLGIIIFSNRTPIIRLLSNVYKYCLFGDFYKCLNLGYIKEDISNSINMIITMIMAIIALFLPALFSLYTTYKKEIYSSLKNMEGKKTANHEEVTTKIYNYQLLMITLEKELKIVSQILFMLLIIVMICTFSISQLNNLNIKGDLVTILLAVTYIELLGYTFLLMFYYQTVIPIYKTLYKFNLKKEE